MDLSQISPNNPTGGVWGGRNPPQTTAPARPKVVWIPPLYDLQPTMPSPRSGGWNFGDAAARALETGTEHLSVAFICSLPDRPIYRLVPIRTDSGSDSQNPTDSRYLRREIPPRENLTGGLPRGSSASPTPQAHQVLALEDSRRGQGVSSGLRSGALSDLVLQLRKVRI